MEKKFVEGQKGDDITPFDGRWMVTTVGGKFTVCFQLKNKLKMR